MKTHCQTKQLAKSLFAAAAGAFLAVALVSCDEGEPVNAVTRNVPPPPQAVPASVLLITDGTGLELHLKHGIEPLAIEDLEVLINGVLAVRTPVNFSVLPVDEDATDNSPVHLSFRLFDGGGCPAPPPTNLPLRQLASAMKDYNQKKAKWDKNTVQWRKDMNAKVTGFVRQVTDVENQVSARFDAILKARQGRDFNRSDIRGTIALANELLSTGRGQKILLLNTDAVDLPMNRRPNTKPMSTQELSPDVVLIFANTSHRPERETLFLGIPNEVRHTDSLKEAMAEVLKIIGSE